MGVRRSCRTGANGKQSTLTMVIDSPPIHAKSSGFSRFMVKSMSTATGLLEMSNRNDGRLRQLDTTYLSDPTDCVVPSHLVQKYDLRPGMMLEVELGKPVGGQQANKQSRKRQPQQKKKKVKYNAIDPTARRATKILTIEGQPVENCSDMRKFEDLTIIDPQPVITLEYPGCTEDCRLIDLFCPIGFGQRGMIVSPPKAGKTTILQNLASAVSKNYPDAEVYALLIDERPEEVTDFRRNVPCTVWASSNDHPPERHVCLAMLAIDRAKRLAEYGKDVVIFMDSLTRLGRAFNTAPGVAMTGRTMSGGVDASALAIPKQLFGAARKFEEGGSLTIIATALIDTGSRGDQVIFEEFKGTGNMEMILDRQIADRRLFPAIDLAASGTRKEHLLLEEKTVETMNALRRRLLNMPPTQQIEQLLKALQRFKTNGDLTGSAQSPAHA